MEIIFSDNGIGFADMYSKEIFLPFKRLQTINDYKGTGIGLALVHKIIELHSGTITAKSVVGEGSIFTITLNVKHNLNNSIL